MQCTQKGNIAQNWVLYNGVKLNCLIRSFNTLPYTVQCIVYTVQCIVDTLWRIVYTLYSLYRRCTTANHVYIRYTLYEYTVHYIYLYYCTRFAVKRCLDLGIIIEQFQIITADPHKQHSLWVHTIVHCTLYSVQCIVYTAVYSVYCTVYSVQCILIYLFSVYLYTIQYTLYTVRRTLYSGWCTEYNVHCIVYIGIYNSKVYLT